MKIINTLQAIALAASLGIPTSALAQKVKASRMARLSTTRQNVTDGVLAQNGDSYAQATPSDR